MELFDPDYCGLQAVSVCKAIREREREISAGQNILITSNQEYQLDLIIQGTEIIQLTSRSPLPNLIVLSRFIKIKIELNQSKLQF